MINKQKRNTVLKNNIARLVTCRLLVQSIILIFSLAFFNFCLITLSLLLSLVLVGSLFIYLLPITSYVFINLFFFLPTFLTSILMTVVTLGVIPLVTELQTKGVNTVFFSVIIRLVPGPSCKVRSSKVRPSKVTLC